MFIDERLLDCVAYGSEFGREFSTRIVSLKNGAERRNAQWSLPLCRYAIVYQALKPEHHQAVYSAHMACMGRLYAFRFKDWTDYRAINQPLGLATGGTETVQLAMTYTFGPTSFVRPIYKPVDAQIYADGVAIGSALDMETGEATFSATAGQVLTWSGEFDIPVRFDDDRLDLAPIAHGSSGFLLSTDVTLTEVRL